MNERLVKIHRSQIAMRGAERQEAVLELKADGLSNRAIADILGVDPSTVGEDLRVGNPTLDDLAPDREDDESVGNPTPDFFSSEDDDWQDDKRETIRQKNEELAAIEVETPHETFETIIIDPPWPMTKIERDVRATKCHKCGITDICSPPNAPAALAACSSTSCGAASPVLPRYRSR